MRTEKIKLHYEFFNWHNIAKTFCIEKQYFVLATNEIKCWCTKFEMALGRSHKQVWLVTIKIVIIIIIIQVKIINKISLLMDDAFSAHELKKKPNNWKTLDFLSFRIEWASFQFKHYFFATIQLIRLWMSHKHLICLLKLILQNIRRDFIMWLFIFIWSLIVQKKMCMCIFIVYMYSFVFLRNSCEICVCAVGVAAKYKCLGSFSCLVRADFLDLWEKCCVAT